MFVTQVCLSAVALAGAAFSACAKDNCYNQVSRQSASAFCATFTTKVVTAVTGFPSGVSTSCGTSRISSACSCLYTAASTTTTTTSSTSTTTTSTSTSSSSSTSRTTSTTTTSALLCTSTPAGNRVVNGDFTSSLSPWFNGDIINESSYGYNQPVVSTPGAGNQTTGHSALFTFPADGIYELDQRIGLPTARTAFTYQFAARTNAPGTCFIIGGFGTDGSGGYQKQFSLTYQWACYSMGPYFLSGSSAGFVAIEVQCTSGSNNAVYVDKVALLPS